MKRTVFFLSDHTGITAEALGRSLLSQFDGLEYDTVHWPFLDTPAKIDKVIQRIGRAAQTDNTRPLVFSTLVDPGLRQLLYASSALVFDFFDTFTGQLEQELGVSSSQKHGRVHSMDNRNAYDERIHAVNFALTNDDGAVTKNYIAAELILLGVSRCGKTPTCLYLGLQYGILAANYPITEDDLGGDSLPANLRSYREKLYGLTIDPRQLQRIRKERRPHGRYAQLEQCILEVRETEDMYHRFRIPYIDTTSMSVEEIAATLLQKTGLESRVGR